MALTHRVKKSASGRRGPRMASASQVLKNYLAKAGEGSRGGHVIGHTKSGRPIYETTGSGRSSSFHEDSKGYTRNDHRDAAALHRKRARPGEDGQLRRDTASRHEAVVDAMKERRVNGYLKGEDKEHEREAAHHASRARDHFEAAKRAPKGSLEWKLQTEQAHKHTDTAKAHRSIAQSLKVGED